MPFDQAWSLQKELYSEVLSSRDSSAVPPGPGYLLFVEHPHVYTLGKSGSSDNLLIPRDLLEKKGASFYHIDRGGDITYHGPGQIVGYPILDLWAMKVGVKDYIHSLEESIILLLATYGIEAGRLTHATGVWLDPGIRGRERKICAIGVKISRGISMHGFAFNVTTDLSYFSLINPCGFTDKAVTSMKQELGKAPEIQEVKHRLREILMSCLTGP